MSKSNIFFRLAYRGFSPYYYLRKYFFMLSHWNEFRARRAVHRGLQTKISIEQRNALSEFALNGWTNLSFDNSRHGDVVALCKNIEAEYESTIGIGRIETAKDFWSVIVGSGRVHQFPKLLEFVQDAYFKSLATLYIGEEAVLTDVSLTRSFATGKEPNHSQLWHLDADDTKILIFYLYCVDVDEGAGPFVLAPRNSIRKTWLPRVFRKHGYSDSNFISRFQPSEITMVVGRAGTLFACDTVNTYHYGSRCVSPKSRLALSFRYSSFSGLYPVRAVPFTNV